MPCVASTLPPELLQMIFSYAVKKEAEEWRYGMLRKHNTRMFALVCRSWKGSAQRLLFRSTCIRTYDDWDKCSQVIKSHAELGSLVRSLAVGLYVRSDELRRWSTQDLSTLLQSFTGLTSFTLSLGERSGGPGYKGDYSALATLPNLQHLSLSSDKFDKDLTSYRQILASAPNLASLSLANAHSRVHTLSSRKRITLINLPSLRRLSLTESQLTRTFDKLKLLDDDTLGNIIDLTLIVGDSRVPLELQKFSGGNLLQQVGQQLQRLETETEGIGGLTLSETLQYCPNVVTLVTRGAPCHIGPIPPSVRTLELHLHHYDASKLMNPFITDSSSDMGNVGTLKVFSAFGDKLVASEAAKQVCAAKRMRLILEGEEIDLNDVVESGV